MNQLVSSADEFQVVDVNKLVRHLGAEEPACSTRADGPGVNIFWIRPNEVTEGTFVGDLLITFNGSNLIERLDVRGEATVHTENLLIY